MNKGCAVAKKTKRKKLTEVMWAIRIGTFADSQPYYLQNPDSTIQTFQRREDARARKREEIEGGNYWIARDWTPVRVDVTER